MENPKYRHEYGDDKIEIKYEEVMRQLAQSLDRILNGETRGEDRENGFILLVFPFGEREGRCNYISNGASREDVVRLLEEQAKRFKESLVKEKNKEKNEDSNRNNPT